MTLALTDMQQWRLTAVIETLLLLLLVRV